MPHTCSWRDKLTNPIELKWPEHVYNDWTNPGLTELSDWMDRQSRALEHLQDTFHQPLTIIQVNKTNHRFKFPQKLEYEPNRTNWTQNFPGSKSSNPVIKVLNKKTTANKNIGNANSQQWTANSSNNTNESSSFSGSSRQDQSKTPAWSTRSLHWQVFAVFQSRYQQTQ